MKRICNCSLFLIVFSILFYSCKNEVKEDNELTVQLNDIQDEILKTKLVGNVNEYELTNTEVFEQFDMLRTCRDKNELVKIKNSIENSLKSSEEKQLNKDEKTIILNYLNILSKDKINNKVLISEKFIIEIQDLSVDEATKSYCKEYITFFKDVLLYFDYDDTKYKKDKSTKQWVPTWIECGSRPCFDCCMNKKIEREIINGNLVAKIQAILGGPKTVLWMGASCGYDCWPDLS